MEDVYDFICETPVYTDVIAVDTKWLESLRGSKPFLFRGVTYSADFSRTPSEAINFRISPEGVGDVSYETISYPTK
jgi:hypothetical protein